MNTEPWSTRIVCGNQSLRTPDPDFIRPGGLASALPELGFHPALRCLVPKLQAQGFVNPIGPLHIGLPAFTAQQYMHTAIAVPHTSLTELLDASCKPSLAAAAGYVVIGRPGLLQDPAGAPDRYAPFPTKLPHQITFSSRLYSFRRMTSCSISGGTKPSYFFFQLKYVVWLIITLQQISVTGGPSAPCFNMNAFWTPENCNAFIVSRSSPAKWKIAEDSSSKWSNFRETDHERESPCA